MLVAGRHSRYAALKSSMAQQRIRGLLLLATIVGATVPARADLLSAGQLKAERQRGSAIATPFLANAVSLLETSYETVDVMKKTESFKNILDLGKPSAASNAMPPVPRRVQEAANMAQFTPRKLPTESLPMGHLIPDELPGPDAGMVANLTEATNQTVQDDDSVCTEYACVSRIDGSVECATDCYMCMAGSDCRDTKFSFYPENVPKEVTSSSDASSASSLASPFLMGRSAMVGPLYSSSGPKKFKVQFDAPEGADGSFKGRLAEDGTKSGVMRYASRYASTVEVEEQAKKGLGQKLKDFLSRKKPSEQPLVPAARYIPQWGTNGDLAGDRAYAKYAYGPIMGIGDEARTNNAAFYTMYGDPNNQGDSFLKTSGKSDVSSSGSLHLELKALHRMFDLSSTSTGLVFAQQLFSFMNLLDGKMDKAVQQGEGKEGGAFAQIMKTSKKEQAKMMKKAGAFGAAAGNAELSSIPSSQSSVVSFLYDMIILTGLIPIMAVALYTRAGDSVFQLKPFKMLEAYARDTYAGTVLTRAGLLPERGDGNLMNALKMFIKGILLHFILKYGVAGNLSTGAEINARGREPLIRTGPFDGTGQFDDNNPPEHRGLQAIVPDLGPAGSLSGSSSFYDRTPSEDMRQLSSIFSSSSGNEKKPANPDEKDDDGT